MLISKRRHLDKAQQMMDYHSQNDAGDDSVVIGHGPIIFHQCKDKTCQYRKDQYLCPTANSITYETLFRYIDTSGCSSARIYYGDGNNEIENKGRYYKQKEFYYNKMWTQFEDIYIDEQSF